MRETTDSEDPRREIASQNMVQDKATIKKRFSSPRLCTDLIPAIPKMPLGSEISS